MKQKLYATLLVLIFITPIIELLNADLVRNSVLLGNLGQLYKGAIIILTCFLLTRKQLGTYVLAVGASLLFALIHYVVAPNPSLSIITADVLFIFKVTYIIPLAFILQNTTEKYIFLANITAWIIIVANIIIGFLGAGYTQYALGYGYKGFFYSGNEMAAVFMVTSAVVLFLLYKNRRFTLAGLFTLALLVMGPLQGMKTLILGLPLISAAIPLLLYRSTIVAKTRGVPKKNLLIGAGVILIVSLGILLISSPLFFQRFGEIMARSGLVGAVLSERDKFLAAGWHMYTNDFSWAQRIFGAGTKLAQEGMIPYMKHIKTIEMDPFDLLFSFGVLALAYYTVWIYSIRQLFNNVTSSAYFLIFLNLLLLGLSVLTGHIVYSSFLATYWALSGGLLKKAEESKHKVIFVGPMSRGGIRTYMIETVAALKRAGYDVPILNTHSFVDFPVTGIRLLLISIGSVIKNEYLTLHYHLATGGSVFRKYLLGFFFWPFANKQILHMHGGKAPEFFTKVLNVKGGKFATELFFSLFSTIIVVSAGLKDDIQKVLDFHHVKYDKSKWTVLTNAIVLPPKLPKPFKYAKGDTLEVLFVGRMVDVKNIPMIATLAKQVEKLPIHFTVVGDGPMKSWLESEIISKELKNITIRGWVSHEEVDKIYQKHHVFLVPSIHESFGIVVLEAYKNGLAVLSSNVGGLRDVVINGETGYAFNVGDVSAFVKALRSFVTQPELLAHMQQAAQKKVREFDYNEHIERLVKILAL